MDFQKIMDDFNANNKKSKEWRAMSPNNLIETLEWLKWDMIVKFSDDTNPYEFQSYRGSYCELALARGDPAITVESFIKTLKKVDGAVYEWCKWWDFEMTWDDIIHIADYGDCSDTYIKAVELKENQVILVLIELDL